MKWGFIMSLLKYLNTLQDQYNISQKDLCEQSKIPTRTINKIKASKIDSINRVTIDKFANFEKCSPEEVVYKILYEDENIKKCSENSLLFLAQKNTYEAKKIIISNEYFSNLFDGIYLDSKYSRYCGIVDSWDNLKKQYFENVFNNSKDIIPLFKDTNSYVKAVILYGISKIMAIQDNSLSIRNYDIIFDSSEKDLMQFFNLNDFINSSYEIKLHYNSIKDCLKYKNISPDLTINYLLCMISDLKPICNTLEKQDILKIKIELYTTSKVLAEKIIQYCRVPNDLLLIFECEYRLMEKGIANKSYYNYKKTLLDYINTQIKDLENGIDDNSSLDTNIIPLQAIFTRDRRIIDIELCKKLRKILSFTIKTYEMQKEKR